MEEQIAVFDCPQLYGKGIPTFYRIQFGGVPHNKIDEILKLLGALGFVSVKLGEDGIWDEFEVDKIYHDKGHCLSAEYFVGGDVDRYVSFWENKEIIERELDNIQFGI